MFILIKKRTIIEIESYRYIKVWWTWIKKDNPQEHFENEDNHLFIKEADSLFRKEKKDHKDRINIVHIDLKTNLIYVRTYHNQYNDHDKNYKNKTKINVFTGYNFSLYKRKQCTKQRWL